MRRSLLLLFLFVSLIPLIPALGQAAKPPTTPESDQLRTAAAKLLQSGSADDAVKAADLFDKASQIDARNAATLKAQTDSGFWPFAVSIVPFLSVVGVAFSFLYNNYQAERKAAQQRLADERKRFVDAVHQLQKVEHIAPATALLSTFTTPPFAELARQTGATLLLNTKSFDSFTDLFNAFVEPVSHSNLKQVVNLLRSVHVTVGPLLTKADNDPDRKTFTPEEIMAYDLLVPERTFLGTKVAMILRQQRDSLESIDLNNLGFDAVDLTGADLRNAYIAPAVWNMVNLDGADLRGINSFQNGYFYNTAWWHAASIDKPFLDYLAEKFPFKSDQYSNTPLTISAEDYDTNLARLRALAK
jgi:hypothetical protein